MLLHMTFRSPNLKARFTSARDEFQVGYNYLSWLLALAS